MFTRKQLEDKVLVTFNNAALPHVANTMQQIQNKIILNTKESSFIERLVEGNYHYANGIADAINKAVLTTDFYQKFIQEVKLTGDYIHPRREQKWKQVK